MGEGSAFVILSECEESQKSEVESRKSKVRSQRSKVKGYGWRVMGEGSAFVIPSESEESHCSELEADVCLFERSRELSFLVGSQKYIAEKLRKNANYQAVKYWLIGNF